MHRRRFLQTTALLTAASISPLRAAPASPRIKISLKCGMASFGKNLEEKFRILKEIGYDGVELDSPGGQNKEEALAASKATGLPIHGVVDSIHWKTCFSDPSEEIREKALEGLLTAIRESHAVGGTAVLIVPGVVNGTTNHAQAVERSVPVIKRALPLAAELGVHILIENVWNRMFYEEAGGDAQGAEKLVSYIDSFDSPWMGSYFDIGNHRKFGKPEEWIRALGKRIVKLDGKDWSKEKGWVDLGEGDVDWPAVRTALAEIQFTGWSTAEVKGGDAERCKKVYDGMRRCLLGV